jgi:hypothetical protein
MKVLVFLLVPVSIIFLSMHAYADEGQNGCNGWDHSWQQDYCSDINVNSARDELLSSKPFLKLYAAHEILRVPECYGVGLSQLAEDIVAKYADTGSIPFLLRILKPRGNHQCGSGLDINLRAMTALSIGNIVYQHIGDRYREDEIARDDVVNTLIDTLGDGYDLRIRMASAQALGDVRDDKAISALQAIVSNPNENPTLQFVAMQSIATLQSVAIEKNCSQQSGQANVDPAISGAAIGDPPPDIAQSAQNYLLLNFAPAYMKLVPQR